MTNTETLRAMVEKWREDMLLAQEDETVVYSWIVFKQCADELEQALSAGDGVAEPDDTYQPVPVVYLQRLWGASFDVIYQGGFDNNSDGFRKAIDHMQKVLAEIRDPVHTNTRLTNFPVFDADGGPLAALESLSASVPSYLSMSCGSDPATREMVAHRIRARIAAVQDALSAAAPAVEVDEAMVERACRATQYWCNDYDDLKPIGKESFKAEVRKLLTAALSPQRGGNG